METAISSEEGLVCQTCGAEGYTNAFVYCVKCLGFVIHRYCLDVVPQTPDELVKWSCDDCKPPLAYHFTSSPKHDPSQSRKEDPPNSALVKTTHPKKIQKKKLLKKRKFDSLEVAGEDTECVSRPTKQITPRVVLGLKRPEPESLEFQKNVTTSLQHLETTKSNRLPKKKQKRRESVPFLGEDDINETILSDNQICVETPSSSLPKEALVNSDSGANQVTPQSAELDKSCPLKGTVKRKRDTIRVPAKKMMHKTEKPTEHSSCESSCTDVTPKNEEDVANTEPDHDKLVSNSSSTEKELHKRSKELDGSVYASQSAYFENSIQYTNQHARPVLDPVWRGSFQINQTDFELFEGFVGHLSSKACIKVCEEATTLPSMLCLEMYKKAHLWPKSFLDSMPSDDNIALYFFPGDTKNERDFVQLVNDMIDDDLAMKATAKNAELLIFTSKVLPKLYWRFQGSHYLWGVFRGKKNDVPVSNHSDNNGLPAKSESKVTIEKEILERVKTVESHSPQSPLCNYR